MSTKSLSSQSLDQEEVHNTSEELKLDENSPRPRLCHLKKWPDFQGYGFNLHAERTKLQQHIGKVDPNSPAESAGLKEGDRIIEVNYVNISNENHQQVVKRIRNGLEFNGELFADQVVLLVLDPEADDFYKKLNMVVKNDMPNVLRFETSDHVVTDEQKAEEVGDEEVEEMEEEEVEEVQPEFKPLEQHSADEEKNHNRVSNCSSEESVKLKLDEMSLQETDSNKANSLHNSTSDLNNNQISNHITEIIKEPLETNNKTSTNSTSSLNNSQERSPLNQSKQSNSSSAASSPAQSQNSTLNRSTSMFPKDEIFSSKSVDIKFKLKGIKAVHEMLQSTKSNPIIRSHDQVERRYDETTVEFRHKEVKPPRPPPPNKHSSYRASTLSTISHNEELDKFLEMSAAEFKNYLKAKGRNDPRVISVDMKRKHEIFQNM